MGDEAEVLDDDVIEVDDLVVDEDVEEDDQEDEDGDDENPEDEEDEEDEKDDGEDKLAELESELQKAQKEINRLGYALRKKEAPKKEEPEAKFTDAQLLNIMNDNADDPAVLFQVVKQMIAQGTEGVKDEAVNAAEIKRTKQELDNYLSTNWPDIKDESSESHKQLTEAKQWMQLDTHPYGDFLATAAVIMQQVPDMIENAKKEAKAEALKEKTEKTRKDKIKSNKAPKGGKKGEVVGDLPSNFNEAAQTLGLNKRQKALYAKMIAGANKGAPMTAEV
jgi:hypothetical protein